MSDNKARMLELMSDDNAYWCLTRMEVSMPPRPPGRPKAVQPKEVKVTVRLTEQEADMLQRLAGGGSLSAALRTCLTLMLRQRSGGAMRLPDTPQALLRRELRKARRAPTPEAAALEPLFALDDPAEDAAPLAAAPETSRVVVYYAGSPSRPQPAVLRPSIVYRP